MSRARPEQRRRDAGDDAADGDRPDEEREPVESERNRGPLSACGRGWRRSAAGRASGAAGSGSRWSPSSGTATRRAGGRRARAAARRWRRARGCGPGASRGRRRGRPGGSARSRRSRPSGTRRRRSRRSRGSARSRSRPRTRLGDRAADALGDLERLLRRRLGQQDRELLAAEARGHVVVAQLGAEDLRDAPQHRVAREVAVRVVDVAQEIEVGHDQRHRPVEALRAGELLGQRGREVARVEEAGLRVDARLLLELRDAQRAVDEEERGQRDRDQPGVRVQKVASATPRDARTRSVDRLSTVKSSSLGTARARCAASTRAACGSRRRRRRMRHRRRGPRARRRSRSARPS